MNNKRHSYSITKQSNSAISVRWLIVRQNSSDPAKVDLGNPSTCPLGVATDTCAASGESVAVELLGIIPRTIRVVSATAVSEGDFVYTTANGKVQREPVSAGTYWCVGRSLDTVTTSNQEIEIIPQFPQKFVVASSPAKDPVETETETGSEAEAKPKQNN